MPGEIEAGLEVASADGIMLAAATVDGIIACASADNEKLTYR